MASFILKTKPIRVSFNMFCCAVFFCWAGVRPRETISGLFGRMNCFGQGRSRFWLVGRQFIDNLHSHQPDHCAETAECEQRMREALYRDG